ncbi:MAG: DUF86 domain-containing protein [Bacteroidales bacterium]|nr:DUF86 domain-containing protein [Bacteroidales bacterium]
MIFLRNICLIYKRLLIVLKANPDVVISNARRIVDTRNYVIHGYDKVSNEIIWSIVVKHLPLLKIEVEDLLNKQ